MNGHFEQEDGTYLKGEAAVGACLHQAPCSRWMHQVAGQVGNYPATYAIFIAGRLTYIGSTLTLRDRLLEHGFGRRWNARLGRFATPLPCTVKAAGARRAGDHLRREARLIARLNPPANIKLRRDKAPSKKSTKVGVLAEWETRTA